MVLTQDDVNVILLRVFIKNVANESSLYSVISVLCVFDVERVFVYNQLDGCYYYFISQCINEDVLA